MKYPGFYSKKMNPNIQEFKKAKDFDQIYDEI